MRGIPTTTAQVPSHLAFGRLGNKTLMFALLMCERKRRCYSFLCGPYRVGPMKVKMRLVSATDVVPAKDAMRLSEHCRGLDQYCHLGDAKDAHERTAILG